MDGNGGDAVGASLVYRHPHGALGDHEAEAPVAVDDGGAGGLALHDEGRAGDDVANVDAVGVGRNLDDTVGVVAAQVGLDQVRGYHLGLGLRGALGAIDVVGRLVQVFWRKNGHNETSGKAGLLRRQCFAGTVISLSPPPVIVQKRLRGIRGLSILLFV